MTDTIKISDFKVQDDRTLLVGCDFDDDYWLHVYILDGEFHFLTYTDVDGEITIISETVSDSAYAEEFVTWANFSETISLELKELLKKKAVKFTIETDYDHTFEPDEDGYLGPIMTDLD